MREAMGHYEPSGPGDKYDLRANLDDRQGLESAVLGRAHLLHGALVDAHWASVAVQGLQTGDAVFRDVRFLDCRFDEAALTATRFERCYFRNTRFVRPQCRSVVFDRCVFDRSGFELPEVPEPVALRFEHCLFVDAPEIPEKRWRDAGLLDAGTRVVVGSAGASATPTSSTGAPPAKVRPPSPIAATKLPPAAAPGPDVPTETAPLPGFGRFSALER